MVRVLGRIPMHFASLRGFEAAARLSSVTAAARELCVTRTAVTHQIRLLEDLLGVQLLVRTNRGVQCTQAGETLLPVLRASFANIGTTLEALASTAGCPALRVTTTPSLAAKWLVPRLGKWRARRESMEIHLLPGLEMLQIERGEADIGIRCGLPPWPGLTSELLLPIHMTPVCSPMLIAGSGQLSHPRDIFNFPLIHADITGHDLGEEWRTWLASAGVRDYQPVRGLSFQDPGLALQAAIDGMGIAIGYRELAAPDLAAGRIVQPFALEVRHRFSYYVVYPQAAGADPLLQAFKSWLLGEADPAAVSPPARLLLRN